MLAHDAETVYIDSRRHGVVLVRPLSRALVLAALGGGGFLLGWPATVPGAVLLAVAALIAGGAVWKWDRTHLVVTTEKLFVVHGTLRRRSAAVHLTRLGTIELDQTLLGRVFGYGTIVAGELEIHDVARPREVLEVVQRLVR